MAIMRPAWLLLLSSLLQWIEIPGVAPDPSPPPCCPKKTVGGIFYSLLGRDPVALSIGCHSDCTYTMDMFPHTTVCFGKGSLEKKCFQTMQPPTTAETTTTTALDPDTTKDNAAPFPASAFTDTPLLSYDSPSTDALPSTNVSPSTVISSSMDDALLTDSPPTDPSPSNYDAKFVITMGKEAKQKLEEANAKLQMLLNPTRSVRAASDIPNSCAKFITKIDQLTIASKHEDMVKVLTVAKDLSNSSSSIVCNETEKDLLTTKQYAISNVSSKVDSLMAQAKRFLDKNLLTDEKLAQNQEIKDATQLVKDRIEANITAVQKKQTTLQSFSSALDSLQSWFFCSFGPDYCKSKNTTSGTTSISPTDNIETTTPPLNPTELETLTASAEKIKNSVEATINEAQEKTVTLKNIKATLFQLQSLLFLGSVNNRESRSLTALSFATQVAPSTAVLFDNGEQLNYKNIESLLRNHLDCSIMDTCANVITCFNEIGTLIEGTTNDKETHALKLATDLKLLKLSDLNLGCTKDEKQTISDHISKATKTASSLEEDLKLQVSESVLELIDALGNILEANEELIDLIPNERKSYVVEFYDQELSKKTIIDENIIDEQTEDLIDDTKKSIEVICCKETTSLTVSCGLGTSCAQQCTSNTGYQLCPTGKCTNNFEDCKPGVTEPEGRVDNKGYRQKRGKFSAANLPSWVINWCRTKCGRARKWPICCFHPTCWRMNLRSCKWLQNQSGTKCRSPGRISNGKWSCSVNNIPIIGKDAEEDSYQANQCRLICDPGFISNMGTLLTCVRGQYEPTAPDYFSCQPAAALIVTAGGDMEVFSEHGKCSKKITNAPPFVAPGQMLNLLDNHLVLLGYSAKEQVWRTSTMEDPLGGILANMWTQRITSIDSESQGYDISYTYLDGVYLSGGQAQKQARLEAETWEHLYERKFALNGSSFTSAACQITLPNNDIMFFGGILLNSSEVISRVMTINVKKHTAQLNGNLTFARYQHACEVINGSHVIVSGGFNSLLNESGSVVPDEIYNLKTEESQQVPISLMRHNHSLIRLGKFVFALGGVHANGSQMSAVEKFNITNNTWSRHPEELLSNVTAGLAVTRFPMSALDCTDCKCGRVQRAERIFGGTTVEVQSFPWIVALLKEGDIQCNRDYKPSYINSHCSATLIGSNFAVTAAHCVFNSETEKVMPASSLSVLPGMNNRSTLTLVARNEVPVVKVLVHEGYVHTQEGHDIAIIKLSKRVDTAIFPPVCLPSKGKDFNGQTGSVFGWGDTGGLFLSETLQAAEVTIGDVMGLGGFGAGANGPGTCQGDSGGPLTVEKGGVHTLAGVVRGGAKGDCGQTSAADNYANVAYYIDWINKTIQDNGGMSSCGYTIATGLITVYVQPAGELLLKKNNVLTTIPRLGFQWEVTFDLKPTKYEGGWHSIVNLMSGEVDSQDVVGARNPGIFIYPWEAQWRLTVWVNPLPRMYAKINPPLNQWSTIVVSQLTSGSLTTVNIKVNGAVFYAVENPSPQELSSVKVYASNKDSNSQAGYIRGLTIKTQ